MKSRRWLTISVVLALAVAMVWAAPTLAQGPGRGQGWGCGQGQGQVAGNTTCPAYPAYQTGQRQGCNNPQAGTGPRGPRGGGRASQLNTQVTPPTQ